MYGAKIMGERPMTVGSTRGAGSVAVEVLAQAGVRRFYTVPGESFLEVLDAVEQHPELSLVSTRHEEALASGSVALVDVVTDPDIIHPSARLSELAPDR